MSSKHVLRGKKVLITSYSYASFGGAELNAIELADQLVNFGAIPYFFSYDIDGPLAQYINERFKTKVMTDQIDALAENQESLGYTELNIEDYDYVWVGGNTVPISIIEQINITRKLPKFIFIHMSQLPGFPLDAPLMPDLERKIASRILSISPRTTSECIERVLGSNATLSYWPNPAPKGFRLLKKKTGSLKRIAVVNSSHPTDEVVGVKEVLENQGMSVELVGKFNDNVQVVDAAFYDSYDLIIGIGKNVKYSLVSGVPVYVYGRFWGSGYLTDENFTTNEDLNFSGRGFSQKTTDEIAKEIVLGYDAALRWHDLHRDEFIQKYSIDVLADKLFSELEKEEPKKVTFDQTYIDWLISTQILIMQNMQLFRGFKNKQARLDYIEEEYKRSETALGLMENSRAWKIVKRTRSVIGGTKRRIRTIVSKDK